METSNDKYDIWTMTNGLKIIAQNITHVRSIAIGAWIGIGSSNEREKESGISHFIEHMVFKGTSRRQAKDFAIEIDEVGGQLNAFTGKDVTCFYAKVIDENLELAVDIIADLIINSVFDEGELEKERGVILEEIAMSEEDPEDIVHELLSKAQFGGQGIGKNILGPASQIKKYTRKDLLEYKKKYYTPDNSVISIVGNYDLDELKDLLEQYFGNWINKEENEGIDKKKNILKYYSKRLFHEKKAEQMHICMGYEGLALGGKNPYMMAMLNNLVGGGMSALLFQRIREELGMAYSVYSYPLSYINGGVLNIYSGSSDENALKVAEETFAVLKKLLSEGIKKETFVLLKNQLRGSYLLGLENILGRMQSLGRRGLLLGKVKTSREILADIESIDLLEMNDLCKYTFSRTPAISVVGNNAKNVLEKINSMGGN